jgi:hypothetical protein
MAGLTPAGGHEILFRLSIFPKKEDGKELRPCLVSKKNQNFPSHRILRHMHGALNIDENKN